MHQECHTQYFIDLPRFQLQNIIHPGGGHLYFRLDIIHVKVLSKHTLNMYFSGMKIDPKYAFLHDAFFLI